VERFSAGRAAGKGRCQSAAGSGTNTFVEFRILGPLEVTADGELVRLGPAKQRALLGALLLRANEVVSREQLVDALWGERSPPTAAKLVQVYVSQLRRLLGPVAGDAVLQTRAPGYLVSIDPEQLDAARFARLVADARARTEAGELDEAVRRYDDARTLWRGSVLADLALESSARNECERLEELRLSAIGERVECELGRGRHAQVVGELEGLTGEYPLHERFWAQLMLALYRSGRQSEALAAYRRVRRLLSELVGLEPSRELSELERAILNHDASLRPARQPTTTAKGRRRWPAGVAVLALGALAGGAFALFGRGGNPIALTALTPNSVGVVDPARNALVAEIRLRTRPAAVAYGDGSLWIAMQDDHTVLRVDPRTLRIEKTIGLGATPSRIATAGPDVWVLSDPAGERLFQIDGGTGTLVRTIGLRARIAVGPFKGAQVWPPISLAAGAGAAWLAGGFGIVTRVDARTGGMRQIAAGSAGGVSYGDRALWSITGGGILRIDPQTLAVERIPAPEVGYQQSVSGVYAANAIWVIGSANPGRVTVWKIDPALRRVTVAVPLATFAVDAAAAANAMWTANSDGTISRIDGRSGRIRTIPLGPYPRIAYPVQLAVGGGRVWLAVH
jgi:DNA-binding SARP family transcriptional activator/streptogramin lyase